MISELKFSQFVVCMIYKCFTALACLISLIIGDNIGLNGGIFYDTMFFYDILYDIGIIFYDIFYDIRTV